ncbi:MAG TPA: sensor histidine kinase [Nocardioidaceae bacterium]|nr:sensor histidine kinase [Nocardioidaceae bacterium]
MTADCAISSRPVGTFRHEAVFYRGLDDLVDRVLPFVRQGVRQGEPVLVAMLSDRLTALGAALGSDAAGVDFVDMAELGRNPARIIPAWRRFLERASDQTSLRGVGEPIWAGRRPTEITEGRLHESLLNVAFDDGPGWELICPYDVEALPSSVIEDAMRTHPELSQGVDRSTEYAGHQHATDTFAARLSLPPSWADEIPFGGGDLAALRGIVSRLCERAGLSQDACEDMVLAAHELAANSLLHGGGRGLLRSWKGPDAFVVEVSDSGTITDPLVGRDLISGHAENGRGVWMANQLCDLVQVRSTSAGAVVRLFAWL